MIEQEIISVELAEKLKELGLRKPSLYSWIQRFNGAKWFAVPTNSFNLMLHPERLNAYSSVELGKMLPFYISTQMTGSQDEDDHIYYFTSIKNIDRWCISYSTSKSRSLYVCMGKSETETRAQMLIWLIENGRVKVDNNSDKVDKDG